MKGEVEVSVMWPTSFARLTAPHSYKLSTLHLSSSIFNCFLLLPECLFYVRSTMEDFCNIPPNEKLSCSMKKTTLIKHIIPAFTKRFSTKRTSLFPRFPPGPHCCSVWTMSVLCFWAKRKESWGLWYKLQKVASEEIDVPCWCFPLKVITGTNSHGSLKILQARLRTRCWYLLIMRALHSGCNDPIWLSNRYTWTLTLPPTQRWQGSHFQLNGCKCVSLGMFMLTGKHVEFVPIGKHQISV